GIPEKRSTYRLPTTENVRGTRKSLLRRTVPYGTPSYGIGRNRSAWQCAGNERAFAHQDQRRDLHAPPAGGADGCAGSIGRERRRPDYDGSGPTGFVLEGNALQMVRRS